MVAALKLYDILRAHRAPVTAYLTGICASAATALACAADRVVMSRQCLYMIHSAGGYAGFLDAAGAAKFLQVTEVYNDTLVSIYVRKTGMAEADVAAMVSAETWMTAESALENGFVDELTDSIDLDLTLPGDVYDYYSSWYYDDDDYWYARYDAGSKSMRSEKEVFTASLKHVTDAGGKILGAKVNAAAQYPKPDNSKSDMSFAKSIVALFTKDGYIPADQSAAAIDAMEKASPNLMASLAKEVKAQIEAEAPEAPVTDPAPATETKTLAEQIAEMSEEDLAGLRKQLGVEVIDEAEAEEKGEENAKLQAKLTKLEGELTKVTNALSAKRAGRPITTAMAPATNGKADVEASDKEDGIKLDEKDADLQMATRMYKARSIDAKTFTQMTGHAAPAR